MAKNERKADFLVPVSENLYCVIQRMQMGALLALWLLENPLQVASVGLLSTLSARLLYYSDLRSINLSVLVD